MAHRYFIQLSFDGSEFHGWQIQPGVKTIQETLNIALQTIVRQEIYCIGCGRTDTGVHATAFYAHFDVNDVLEDLDFIMFKLNCILPTAIALQRIFEVKPSVHARFSAISRTYIYRITRVKDPFSVNRRWELRDELDVDLMNDACKILIGEHDFSSFSRSQTQTKTNICRVTQAQWENRGNELIFTISANRFLRNMVRATVGTLILVGKKKIDIEGFKEIIALKDRRVAGRSAPACGLYLTNIGYKEEINL